MDHITLGSLMVSAQLWTRDVEALAPVMVELGVGLVPYSPLGRGFLTGGVTPDTLGEKDSRRRHPRFQGDNATANQRLVATIGAAAQNLGVTSTQLALAWVYARGSRLGIPVVPIPGTSSPEHVTANVKALDIVLEDTVLAELEPLAQQVSGGRNGALQMTAVPS